MAGFGVPMGAQAAKAFASMQAFGTYVRQVNLPAGLAFACEMIVNYAKQFGPWTDRTGALRRSIGYAVLQPGQSANVLFPGSALPKGGPVAIKNDTEDVYGVVFAGMKYGVFVEHKPGYWVLSGAVEANRAALTALLGKSLKITAVPRGKNAKATGLR